MKGHFRRNHLRTYRKVPIRWCGVDNQQFPALEAKTVNTSTRGMCFETPQKIEPGTEIAISLAPDASPPPRKRGNDTPIKARVCWCNTIDKACFDIGVRYLTGEEANA